MRRLADWKARAVTSLVLRGIDDVHGLRLTRCLKSAPTAAVFEGRFKGRDVVVKRMIGPEADLRAGDQADELKTQYPHMAEGDFRVPEPIVTLPGHGLVVMERAGGQRLDHAIRATPADRWHLIRQAGQWLAKYTSVRRVEDAFGGGYWIKVRRRFMSQMPQGPDRDRIARLVAVMEAERNRIGPRPITRARSHGDFCTINLMVDGDTMWGVDIQNSHWLALAKDLARFLVFLEITLPNGAGDGPCGLAAEDVEALVDTDGLIRSGEARLLLQYFVASELAGRLEHEQAHPEVLENARKLADRMLA